MSCYRWAIELILNWPVWIRGWIQTYPPLGLGKQKYPPLSPAGQAQLHSASLDTEAWSAAPLADAQSSKGEQCCPEWCCTTKHKRQSGVVDDFIAGTDRHTQAGAHRGLAPSAGTLLRPIPPLLTPQQQTYSCSSLLRKSPHCTAHSMDEGVTQNSHRSSSNSSHHSHSPLPSQLRCLDFWKGSVSRWSYEMSTQQTWQIPQSKHGPAQPSKLPGNHFQKIIHGMESIWTVY